MEINAANRQVTLSVGEFASFAPYASPGFGGIAAMWRAQLGTEWHQRIQRESTESNDGFSNEVTISGALPWRNWTLHLSGRIDQIKTASSSKTEAVPHRHLREIKTITEPLPLDRDALLERYPSYPVQLLTYRELLIRDGQSSSETKLTQQPAPESFQLELLFVEVGSGLTQTLSLDPSYDALLVDQLDALVDYLESKQERLTRLRFLAVKPAYDTPRPGQESIQGDLKAAFEKSRFTLLEAPTGYGKTGVAWEYAARRLSSGKCDRVLYLTSKATGQTEALTRLRSLLEKSTQNQETNSPPASFWQIRNKSEHCIHTEFRCSRQTCPYLNELHEKWKRSGLQRLYLLSQHEVDLEDLKSEGRSTGICPYEIMRASLGHRDIWIGDYNYLFSPHSARLLADQPDFDPARTFLIIDEAHNLPSRVQSAFTYQLALHPTYAAIDDLTERQAPASLRQHLKSLASILAHVGSGAPVRAATQTSLFQDFSPNRSSRVTSQSNRHSHADKELDDATVADLRHSLAKVSELLISDPLPFEELQPETLELLFLISAAQTNLQRGELRHQFWSPELGSIKLECIDASKLIASQLSHYNGALFLSATLSPIETYIDEIGLSQAENLEPNTQNPAPYSHLTPPAPWRDDAYDVAIDLRIDTRFKTRRAHLSTTAATIANAAENAGPAIAFFPSYTYAQQAFETLQLEHPFIRVALQPRSSGTLAEQSSYLEESLAFNDALILILGSSFAEGIDTIGGKAGTAIVVSPALPEMNFIQESKRRFHSEQGRDGFERAYLNPGIQKVNQALGRLVRSPEHRVKALLHCQRFAEPKTRNLLDPLYRSSNYIHSNEDLASWLQQ